MSVATVFCALLTECSKQLLICNDGLASHKADQKSSPRAASAQLPSKLQCRLYSGSLFLSSSFQIAASVLMWETPHGASSSLKSASHYLILPFVFFFFFFFNYYFCPVCAGGVVLRSTLVRTAGIMVNIPEYYAGKTVLITGATGFMGKVQ